MTMIDTRGAVAQNRPDRQLDAVDAPGHCHVRHVTRAVVDKDDIHINSSTSSAVDLQPHEPQFIVVFIFYLSYIMFSKSRKR